MNIFKYKDSLAGCLIEIAVVSVTLLVSLATLALFTLALFT